MTDTDDAVETFLDQADSVFEDYENGYVDPDAALSTLEHHVETLREETD
ncbi:hypothetical protein [Halococcus saccharolyticus]|uniref:Uncharacterized protein n=1 Tax=Halococcus saccharolyticus DSM 5350 TaxID=1227455 RepID=M0MIE0_9EURY|nr:hypothetical protein [Halococcus saccharolyticus]EMA45451.1 hypothetical protein C449_07510 [Halococcus saccharolyticus DSM 5350]